MRFLETKLLGAFLIDPERRADERGFFARVFCVEEFQAQGLETHLVQSSISFNRRKGTLRGMHFQTSPFEEARLVRCTIGAVYDVILDLRPGSSTFKQWLGIELSADNRRMVYIPRGFAHGFLTMADNSEVFYQISEYYHPEAAQGVRWDDPAFSIQWPLPISLISDKDLSYKDFNT
ncbi:MAG: dTDP-4-dehydrorhamnose 3,5-epimerase [Planctomycetes bacterium]|nr:dTDP-4-dehydrorhamnose 3,5-epimerase [Planctomycetota bacterium]